LFPAGPAAVFLSAQSGEPGSLPGEPGAGAADVQPRCDGHNGIAAPGGEMSGARRKLFLLHLVANALLLWLGYEWLGVGESTRMRLVWSALDALAILGLVCWFHGATLVFFRKGCEAKINEAFRVALRHVPALVTATVAVLALYGLLAWAAGASGQPAFRLASWLTLKLRTPVRTETVTR